MVPELLQRAFKTYCHANIPDEIVFKIIVNIEVDRWNARALRVQSDQAELARLKDWLAKHQTGWNWCRPRVMRKIEELERLLASDCYTKAFQLDRDILPCKYSGFPR